MVIASVILTICRQACSNLKTLQMFMNNSGQPVGVFLELFL